MKAAEVTSNPVTSPEKLASRISDNQVFKFVATVFGLVFFALYAYKTWLDVKVAKQELKLNEQESVLNKKLLDEQSLNPNT